MSAESRFSASSKEMRVRVLASKKRLTTVLPRSAGTFLIARVEISFKVARGVEDLEDLARRQLLEAEQVLARPGRHRRSSPPAIDDAVLAVDLAQQHLDRFAARGRDVLADEVGADRQLAVAAVDQHRELDRARAAEVHERVERRAHGAAGEEHVVDQHHVPALDGEGHLGALHARPEGARAPGRRGRA